jgi:cytoskeletal protein CcmA (bactofilin family)
MFNKQEKKVAEVQLANGNNSIANGTSIVGDVETFGSIRIDGKVKGNITTKNKLVLGPTSFIDGNILAQNAEIEGEVTGTVEVTELLILKATAKVSGDIVSNKISVEPGAAVRGTFKVGDEAKAKEIKINTNMDGSAKGEEAERIQQTAKAKSA